MKKNKKIIIIGLICSLLLISSLVLFFRDSQIKTEPEKSEEPTIELIDKGNSLYYTFVTDDFVAVRYAMTKYAIKQGGNPYTYKFKINDVISPVRDGFETTIDAVLLDDNDRKVKDVIFVVKIPPDGSEPMFTVPEEDLSEPLYGGI